MSDNDATRSITSETHKWLDYTTYSSKKVRFDSVSTTFGDEINIKIHFNGEEKTDNALSVYDDWAVNINIENWDTDWNYWGASLPIPKRKIGSPDILTKRKRNGLGHCNPAEQKARDLLSRFIGPKRFRRYMRDGFICHTARSGKVYQLFPNHKHTMVWEDGKVVEKLCLCVDKLPPTDSVVMRLLLLQHSEDTFRYHEKIVAWKTAPDRRTAPYRMAA